MYTEKINDLVKQIRANLDTATVEQKNRLAGLLEQIVTQQPQTAESLAQEQEYMEKLLPAVRKIGRQALAELHEFEMRLRMLAPEGTKQHRGRITDVVGAIEQAIDAVDLLQSRVYDIENVLVQSIQHTGWDIKDLQDEQRFVEEVGSKPMVELDLGPRNSACYLKGYKCYQNSLAMVNPYEQGTKEYRDWQDGYHQAVIDRVKTNQ